MVEILGAQEKVAQMVRAQVRILDHVCGYDREDLLSRLHFRRYVYGAFDAVTVPYGSEIRAKIGRRVAVLGIGRYLAEDFDAADGAGEALVAEIQDLPSMLTDLVVIQAGNEVMAMMHGQAPSGDAGLLAKFMPDETCMLPDRLPTLEAFAEQDELRLQAIRKHRSERG